VRAAVKDSIGFYSVTNYLAATVRQCAHFGASELIVKTVEDMRLAGYCDLKRFVILITAGFAPRHRELLLSVAKSLLLA
jgi:hypothetical protein